MVVTNIIAFLHTTTAYQTAALQLMVGEANFAAKQLDLKEPLPIIIPADTNNWSVAPPPEGIGGFIATSNYFFEFQHGQLSSIHKRDWLHKVSPPVNNILDLANRPSLINTNSAYQLAAQWLTSISINVAEMERTSPPVIFHVMGDRRDTNGRPLPGDTNIWAAPLFMIGWGEDPVSSILHERPRQSNRPLRPRPPSPFSPVYVEILGTTKELVELEVRDESLFKSAPLQLTNAAELLGPLPPPQHFVEQILGGKNAYQTVMNPDKVEAWLLTPDFDENGNQIPKANRTPAVKLSPSAVKNFSSILADFDSYGWRGKYCTTDFGVRLRFTRGNDTVEFLLCYECDILEVSYNGQVQTSEGNFDPAHLALVKAIQSVFPNDEVIKNLH